jgi:multidrug efflux pump
VQDVVGFIGSGSTNSGSVFIILKSLNQRKISSELVIARLRGKLKNVAGATLYMQSAQDLVIGGRQGNSQFQYTISADSISDVNKYTPLILKTLGKIKGVADTSSDQRNHGLQAFVKINYDTAAQFGITPKMVDDTLYSAFGQAFASTMYKDMNQYYVVLEVAPKYTNYPEILKEIYVKSTTGDLVPLSEFASFENSSTLLSVNHQGLSPSATVSFNLLPGIPLGNAVQMVEEAALELNMPSSVRYAFRGSAQAFQDSLKNEPYLILASLISVYVVLGMLYESLIHPVTILSCLPSAAIGALLALSISKTDLTIIALIGIILLIGIVKKNAIMMIDFVLSIQREQNITPRDAIYQAALLRFRPIMMTTMAALLGAVPLAFSHGVGAEMRQPLGVVIIGGLVFSQMLTLYTTPVIYLFMESLKEKLVSPSKVIFATQKNTFDGNTF